MVSLQALLFGVLWVNQLPSQDMGPRCQREMQAQSAGGCQDTSPDAYRLFVPLKTTKKFLPSQFSDAQTKMT